MHGAVPFWHGVFPPEWYRYHRIPKGSPLAILFLSGTIFAVAVASFGILAVVGSHKTLTQSEVSPTDKPGINDWSCEMVSRPSCFPIPTICPLWALPRVLFFASLS